MVSCAAPSRTQNLETELNPTLSNHPIVSDFDKMFEWPFNYSQESHRSAWRQAHRVMTGAIGTATRKPVCAPLAAACAFSSEPAAGDSAAAAAAAASRPASIACCTSPWCRTMDSAAVRLPMQKRRMGSTRTGFSICGS